MRRYLVDSCFGAKKGEILAEDSKELNGPLEIISFKGEKFTNSKEGTETERCTKCSTNASNIIGTTISK
uniref:Uncharacterized protein n=1 Tax=Pristionchus pacificus TaxID=54126 RepID=A0A2A6CKU3_PRIPA|eukprot:PDM78726.1 hypothetical protein PRIPAC_31305 [Pristionchus pacificus]